MSRKVDSRTHALNKVVPQTPAPTSYAAPSQDKQDQERTAAAGVLLRKTPLQRISDKCTPNLIPIKASGRQSAQGRVQPRTVNGHMLDIEAYRTDVYIGGSPPLADLRFWQPDRIGQV